MPLCSVYHPELSPGTRMIYLEVAVVLGPGAPVPDWKIFEAKLEHICNNLLSQVSSKIETEELLKYHWYGSVNSPLKWNFWVYSQGRQILWLEWEMVTTHSKI